MKHLSAAIVPAILLCVACSKTPKDQRPVIAVSIEPERYLLEQIADSDYRIVTVLDPGANPETFEPSMARRADIEASAAYFAVGGLPFERQLRRGDAKVRMYDIGQGIKPVYGTHDHGDNHDADGEEDHSGHDHGEGDPHTWISVKNARIMARNMYQALAEMNPAKAERYRNRYESLDSRLDSMDRAVAGRLAGAETRTFVVWHPSLSYFARDYGLNQVSVGWESKEASPSAMRHAVDKAREADAEVLFLQREFDSRQVGALNTQIGLREVIIDPMSYDWEKQINLITDELSK